VYVTVVCPTPTFTPIIKMAIKIVAMRFVQLLFRKIADAVVHKQLKTALPFRRFKLDDIAISFG
jgi:hypothetical protein